MQRILSERLINLAPTCDGIGALLDANSRLTPDDLWALASRLLELHKIRNENVHATARVLCRILEALPPGPVQGRIIALALQAQQESGGATLVLGLWRYARRYAQDWKEEDIVPLTVPPLASTIIQYHTPWGRDEAVRQAPQVLRAELAPEKKQALDELSDMFSLEPWLIEVMTLEDFAPLLKVGDVETRHIREMWSLLKTLAGATITGPHGTPARFPFQVLRDRARVLAASMHVVDQEQLLLDSSETLLELLGPAHLRTLAEQVVALHNPALTQPNTAWAVTGVGPFAMALLDRDSVLRRHFGDDWALAQTLKLVRSLPASHTPIRIEALRKLIKDATKAHLHTPRRADRLPLPEDMFMGLTQQPDAELRALAVLHADDVRIVGAVEEAAIAARIEEKDHRFSSPEKPNETTTRPPRVA